MARSVPDRELVRDIGLFPTTAIVIGGVIGTGVFLKARVMTCNVDTPGMVITVWGVAGLLSVLGALTYAELAAAMPRAGGEYVFIHRAYGRLWGFLYGWTRFFVANAGGQAALATGCAIFLNALTSGALGGELFGLGFGGVFVVGRACAGRRTWRPRRRDTRELRGRVGRWPRGGRAHRLQGRPGARLRSRRIRVAGTSLWH